MARTQPRYVEQHQKNVVKLFQSLTGEYNLWQVWADFVAMAAISISNIVDKRYFEQREQMYENIRKKYKQKQLDVFVEIFAEIVMGLDKSSDQDFLGELFMALELGNNHGGQFFTPYCVCRVMAEMNTPDLESQIAERGWISCNDPAAGAGATLIAFANTCEKRGINYQTKVLFVAQEIDFTTALMCYLQLSLMGCAGYVIIQNTLTNPGTSYDGNALLPAANENYWFTPGYFREEWAMRRAFAKIKLLVRKPPIVVETEELEEVPPEEQVVPSPLHVSVQETAQEPVQESLEIETTGQFTLF